MPFGQGRACVVNAVARIPASEDATGRAEVQGDAADAATQGGTADRNGGNQHAARRSAKRTGIGIVEFLLLFGLIAIGLELRYNSVAAGIMMGWLGCLRFKIITYDEGEREDERQHPPTSQVLRERGRRQGDDHHRQRHLNRQNRSFRGRLPICNNRHHLRLPTRDIRERRQPPQEDLLRQRASRRAVGQKVQRGVRASDRKFKDPRWVVLGYDGYVGVCVTRTDGCRSHLSRYSHNRLPVQLEKIQGKNNRQNINIDK